MKVTVAMATYMWARALPYLLTSVASQTRKPEEEVIALKPSGESSEEVMRSFSSQLPIKLVVQVRGNFADVAQMAIDNAKGDVMLFLDDAVAEERWGENTKTYSTPCPTSAESAEKYTKHIKSGKVVKTHEPFYDEKPPRNAFHRKPLPEYVNYCG